MREVGRLQRPLQDGDCVVLGGDIAEALWTTEIGAWSENKQQTQQAGKDIVVDVLLLHPGLRSRRV